MKSTRSKTVAREQLLNRLDQSETVAGIRRGLESMKKGEGIPLEDFKKTMRTKYGRGRTK